MSKASLAVHVVTRFFSSLPRTGPRHEDETWAAEKLLVLERELWASMSNADRRHGVAVARRVLAAIGPQVTRPVLAAALLHDVGKTTAGLGTFGRVVATLVITAAGRRRVETWNKGFRRCIALYSRHAEIGADLLAVAESDASRSRGLVSTIGPRRRGVCRARSAGFCVRPTRGELLSVQITAESRIRLQLRNARNKKPRSFRAERGQEALVKGPALKSL